MKPELLPDPQPLFNICNNPIVVAAYYFAFSAHAGQERKYTGEPYIVHPLAVATTIAKIMPNGHDRTQMVCGALLHDTVEDCNVTLNQIRAQFTLPITQIVDDMTKRDNLHPDWSRAERKWFEADRLSRVQPHSQTVKLADLIDNTWSIIPHDPKFAKVYLAEKRLLVEKSLVLGHPVLLDFARKLVDFGEANLYMLEEAA